jgi:hypothetical protein
MMKNKEIILDKIKCSEIEVKMEINSAMKENVVMGKENNAVMTEWIREIKEELVTQDNKVNEELKELKETNDKKFKEIAKEISNSHKEAEEKMGNMIKLSVDMHNEEKSKIDELIKQNKVTTIEYENKLSGIQSEIAKAMLELEDQFKLGNEDIKENVNNNFETFKLVCEQNVETQNESLMYEFEKILTRFQELIINMDRKIALKENLIMGKQKHVRRTRKKFERSYRSGTTNK